VVGESVMENLGQGAIELLEAMRRQLDRIEGKVDALFAVRSKEREGEAKRMRAMVGQLTPKQHATVQMVVAGATEVQVAERLGVSRNTAKLHKAAALHKVGANSVAELARWWREMCVELSEREYSEISGVPRTWAASWREGDVLPAVLAKVKENVGGEGE
jgi:FixJ family two-component response regulator